MASATYPFSGHDHARCLSIVLKRAESECLRSGARLTPLRKAVLLAVAASHKAQGAYDIIEAMGRNGDAPPPISVYRALDFLVAHGLVHKIESRNAFVACCHGGHSGEAVLMICETCGVVAEMEAQDELDRLADKAAAHGFTPSHTVTELSGTCQACAAHE